MAFLAKSIIPDTIEDSLTHKRFDPLPGFSIHDTNGQVIDSDSLRGKVLVIYFFGTWCKPCILELRELHKVKIALQAHDDVVFLIMNPDIHDTPEKFDAFIEKTKYPFLFAYDHDSHIYKQLKLQQAGLPTLLLIDKDQKIRQQHIGYNPAESNFSENLIEAIQDLR